MRYDHKKIEKKWQKEWTKKKLYRTDEKSKKPKFYVLDMFPYPSGEGLHVGHPRGYIGTDVVARYKMMRGYNVLHPMGWDAFGLPAENYALKNKIHPRVAVEKNIKRYKEQLGMIGFTYDWSREINTTDPSYYKWTQWIFLQLFHAGLAYQSFEPINWCPSCQTGLANEDLEEGKCEQCGSEVEKKPIRQWVLKMTAYAEKLLEDLKLLDWDPSIIEQQRNWIGKSEGAEFEFPLYNVPGQKDGVHKVRVFTTRADTLFGATFVAVSAELATKWLDVGWKADPKIKGFIEKTLKVEAGRAYDEVPEKDGMFTGIFAENPVNKERLPVWIANYVLSGYGTGAIMAVPAHDQRDYEFAKKYKLPIVPVIAPTFGKKQGDEISKKATFSIVRDPKTNRVIVLNWGPRKERYGGNMLIGGTMYEGETPEETARREIAEETGYTDMKLIRKSDVSGFGYFYSNTKQHNVFAEGTGLYFELTSNAQDEKRLDDGEHGKFTVEWQPVERVADLLDDGIHEYYFRELVLGECFTKDGVLINSGKFNGMMSAEARKKITDAAGGKTKIQYKMRDWVFSRQRYWGEPIPIIHCDVCGAVPVPEKDLPVKLPEVKSYEPTGTGESPLAAIEKWVRTKCPKCGGKGNRETNTMPQWAGSSWYYLRYIDPKNKKVFVDPKKEKKWLAPARRSLGGGGVDLYVGGVEHATRHLLYARFWHKALFDLGYVSTKEPFQKLINQGLILAADGRKMSKRWKNVVNPDDIIEAHGADSLRLYEMFMGPFGQSIAWSTNGLVGMRRFLERTYKLISNQTKNTTSQNLDKLLHKTIKKVTDDIENFRFNTAISALMILLNDMEKEPALSAASGRLFVKLLAPFIPHLADDLWQRLRGKKSVFSEAWPEYDEKLTVEDEFDLVMQVNGRVRDVVRARKGISEADAHVLALASEKVQKITEGKEIKKLIFVKDRLINMIV